MNFNFTDGCRKILSAARQEALDSGAGVLGPEHVLLGALGDAEVREILERLGVPHEEARSMVLRLLPAEAESYARSLPEKMRRTLPGRQRRPGQGEIPYTSRAKKTLEFAMAEAREAGDDYVGSPHLLLGLVREETGLAARILAEFDITLDRARAARAGIEVEPRSRLRITLDDSADLSIYEQIVAQVTEAIATGSLRPGERLPTVRRLADELDIAPGTVARAYSELERQKRVVTEGARGTRVAERQDAPPVAGNRPETLAGLLRPVAVAAFHLGGSADELRTALEQAMQGIFDRDGRAA